MNIQIQILSVGVETRPTEKGSYQVAAVSYKDLTNGGKVNIKQVMSFTNKEVFETLVVAKATDVYDVEMVKGEKYWDWTKVTKGVAVAPGVTTSVARQSASGSTSTNSRGYETPEERAKKQIYIVRQSSLGNAIATLTVGRKSEIKPNEVIELAKQYESYVFSTAEDVVAKDVGGIEELEEDLPF